MLSLLAGHDPKTVVKGLNDIPRDLWPNLAVTHLAFDVMVGLGSLLMLVSLWFWLGWWRKKKLLLANRWLLRTIVICGPTGFLALEAGWIVTEVGRQPWVVNGIMKTRDAVTTSRGVPAMFFLFTSLYLVLTATVAIYLWRLSHATRIPAPQEAHV
jgi:cytochrome d ubiquinol oxidase subunit I